MYRSVTSDWTTARMPNIGSYGWNETECLKQVATIVVQPNVSLRCFYDNRKPLRTLSEQLGKMESKIARYNETNLTLWCFNDNLEPLRSELGQDEIINCQL